VDRRITSCGIDKNGGKTGRKNVLDCLRNEDYIIYEELCVLLRFLVCFSSWYGGHMEERPDVFL